MAPNPFILKVKQLIVYRFIAMVWVKVFPHLAQLGFMV